jgi:hypothetical protein
MSESSKLHSAPSPRNSSWIQKCRSTQKGHTAVARAQRYPESHRLARAYPGNPSKVLLLTLPTPVNTTLITWLSTFPVGKTFHIFLLKDFLLSAVTSNLLRTLSLPKVDVTSCYCDG